MSNMIINYIKNRTDYIQLSLVFVYLCVISLGQVDRWDLLEQIAMADRLNAFGTLYPPLNEKWSSGVSVYFPGVAILAAIFQYIIPDEILVEVMLLIAVLFVLAFYQIQKLLLIRIYPNVDIKNFPILFIIFSLFILIHWLIYTVEFKPDIAAFVFGVLGIFISGADNNNKVDKKYFIIGVFIAGSAIVFKQQYLAFLMGMLLYSIVVNNKKFRIFTLMTILVSSFFLYLILSNPSAMFWNYTVLSDDGFASMKTYYHVNKVILYRLLNFLSFLGVLSLLQSQSFGTNIFTHKKAIYTGLLSTPWPFILLFSSSAAFLSATKVGGNAGNTGLGIMLLFPLIYIFFQKVNFKGLVLFLIVVFLFRGVPKLINQYERYLYHLESFKVINSLGLKDTHTILVGSDLYGIVRATKVKKITNYWTVSMRNSDAGGLSSILNNKSFDLLVVEPRLGHMELIKGIKKYELVYIGNSALVAKNIETFNDQ